jgi:hypothetical protein
MGNTAVVGLGVLAHPTFSAKVFGANDRLVMGIFQEPWARTRWLRPEPVKEKLPGGVTRTIPHIQNFLECVRSRTPPTAPVEVGHQAVRTLHLANLAQRKRARAVLSEDGEKAVTSDK